MATVTGLTAARMLEIEAQSVIDAEVSGDVLFLTRFDGSIINAGNVRGPQGDPGPISSDLTVLTAQPILDVGLAGQIRAGRQLTAADFTNMGISAPLGLWNLSDLTDVSGNARNLTNKGGVPFSTGINGLATTAARFSGSTAQALYISDTGAADPFRIRTGSWGCWFKTAKRGTGQYLVSKHRPAALSYGLFISSTNTIAAELYADGSTVLVLQNASTDVCDDRWHFAVATFDGAVLKLYVDGVLETVVSASGLLFSGAGPVNIGGYNADGATITSVPHFGKIDEAFITGDILTEEQIRNLYCAKITHALGQAPTRITLNVRRRRRGAALVVGDFPSQPVRLHNFSAGSLGDDGSGAVALTNPNTAVSVAGADGTASNAFNFNGAQSLASTDTGLPGGTTVRSYGCWFKTSLAGATMAVISWGTQATGDEKILINTGAISSANIGDVINGPNVTDGQWHQVVLVADNAAVDGLKRKLYLDGRLVASSVNLNSITLGGANRFRVGANPDASAPFTGQIDGAFVHNVALTTEQVQSLFAKGAQTLIPSPKNVGDHIEGMSLTTILAAFDTLDTATQVDLGVAA